MVALRTEKSEGAPWIARVTSQDDGNINIMWMEVSYNRRWKMYSTSEKWKGLSGMERLSTGGMSGFELTNTQRLRKETVSEPKKLYKRYF